MESYSPGSTDKFNFLEKIFHKRDKTVPDHILKEVMGYHSVPDVPAVMWGKRHEAAAKNTYIKNMQKEHPGLQVEDCGLFIDKTYSFLAASPDGIVICNHCCPSVGLVEIKCPFTHRNCTLKEACENKAFFCAIENNYIRLKHSHTYYCQMQGQMGITGKPWVDFVVWTLKDLHVERIYFDPKFWSLIQDKLKQFFLEGVVPELFSRRVQRCKSLY